MKKFKKLFVSIFAVVALALPVFFAACDNTGGEGGSGGGEGDKKTEAVDYVSTVSLDFSSNTKKQEVKVRLYVDGDTTHFDPVTNSSIATNPSSDFTKTQGYIKARYLAVNTPESTGKIEPWGGKAAKFTRSKLESAQTIIVESDDDKWNIDSTGERYTLWIWYLPKGATQYRNLNLEILQEGLALGSNAAGNRYGTVATEILAQARSLELYVFSKEKDPDFPYGAAQPVTLKELRCHIDEYNGKRIRVEGIVAAQFNNSVYIEELDVETGSYFGMAVYYGFKTGTILDILSIGNRVSVAGVVNYYEAGDSYQISDVDYDPFAAQEKNTIKLSEGNTPAFTVVEASDVVSGTCSFQFIKETEGENGEILTEVETKELAFGEAVMSTSVTVKNLRVMSIYTTNNGGKSDGAMSITCEYADGKTIVIRTEVLKDANGNLITATQYQGKTITVKGIIEKYDGQYQIKCYRADHIEVLD